MTLKRKKGSLFGFGFFGRPKLIFLNSKMPEGNYNYQQLKALKNNININKITWLIKANLGIFYIEFIRKFSYFPRFQRLLAKIENQIFNLNYPKPCMSKSHNPVLKEQVFSADVIESLRLKAIECGRFKSPYAPNKTFNLINKDQYTSLWNFEQDFLHLNEFIKISCEKTLVEHCQKILGPNAQFHGPGYGIPFLGRMLSKINFGTEIVLNHYRSPACLFPLPMFLIKKTGRQNLF